VLADEAPGLHQVPVLREEIKVRSLSGLSSLPMRRLGVHDVAATIALRRARGSGGPRSWTPFNAAEVMAVRPEDKYARQVQQAFAEGATLAELEQHITFLRSLGAPDDAHPRVGVSDDYEVTMIICVVERRTVQVSSAS
jgi:hypothetical protein